MTKPGMTIVFGCVQCQHTVSINLVGVFDVRLVSGECSNKHRTMKMERRSVVIIDEPHSSDERVSEVNVSKNAASAE